MTVQELIDLLQNVTDKSVNVYAYYSGDKPLDNSSLAHIQMVDDDLGSRVDINITD